MADILDGFFQVEYQGIRFGGNNKEIVTMDLFTAPTIRTNDVDKPQQDGEYEGDDYYGARRFSMDIELWGATPSELQGRIRELLLATAKQKVSQPLKVRLEGWNSDLTINARPIRRSGILDVEAVVGHVARFSVEWRASDPFLYEDTKSHQLALATVTGGGSFDAAFDYTFGGASSVASDTFHNAGNADAFPTITYTGPLTDPELTVMLPSGGVSVMKLIGTTPEGSTVIITSKDRLIKRDGVSIYPELTDPLSWWVLEPGFTTVEFRGTDPGGTVDPTATIAWESTTV
jgi:hypothetical protein